MVTLTGHQTRRSSRRRQIKSIDVPVTAAGASDRPIAANALISDITRRKSLNWAIAFKLEALRRQTQVAKREPRPETVVGRVHFEGCFSLRMQPLPEGTDDLRATVRMMDAVPGYMFLVTVS